MLCFISFLHRINLQHELEMTITENKNTNEEHNSIIHMRDGSGLNKAESSRGVKRSTSGSIFKIRCGM